MPVARDVLPDRVVAGYVCLCACTYVAVPVRKFVITDRTYDNGS